jgi:hypothetical protein
MVHRQQQHVFGRRLGEQVRSQQRPGIEMKGLCERVLHHRTQLLIIPSRSVDDLHRRRHVAVHLLQDSGLTHRQRGP